MSSGDSHQIHAALTAAQKSIREALAAAIDPATSALKTLVRAAPPGERPMLSQALAVLQLSRQPLLAAFEKALAAAVDEEVTPEGEASGFHDPTDWMSVGLVDEDQFEDRLAFERVGQVIAHECEPELRELTAYTGELLNVGWADPASNPMRGQVIGAALYQAVESVAEGGACRRILVKELGQALAKALPSSYRGIVKDFSSRGFRQVDLTVRPSPPPVGGGANGGVGANGGGVGNGANSSGGFPDAPAGASGAAAPGFEAMRDLWEKSMLGRMPVGGAAEMARAWEASIRSTQAMGFVAPPAGAGGDSSAALLERLMQEAMSGAAWQDASGQSDGSLVRGGGGGGSGSGIADVDLMRLLRRLNDSASARPSQGAGAGPARTGAEPTFFGASFASTGMGGAQSVFAALPPTNLIRAHHDELVQAATGEVDHMVIEVVASLFDQILADTRVPPQIAREIARLQMPVLRVALRDTSFFSVRRHPVRRFINRISTLAAGFGEFENGPGKELLVRVNALVTEIVEGDFDQVPLYVKKLGELEQFVSANARVEFEKSPAGATLQAKEAEWQAAQVFSGRLHEAYENLPIPGYLKEFLASVWSQAIVASAQGSDADPAREKRFRRAAFHLVASIQPKRSIEERNEFLAGLRGLTGTLDEGLALIGWPKEEHDAFFGKLIADHSGSLKAAPGSDLDRNMLLRQLDVAARMPLPDAGEASAAASAPEGQAFEPRFTAQEARRVGLVDEAAVDWSKPANVAAAKESVAPVADASTSNDSGATIELDFDLATRPAPLDEPPIGRTAVAKEVAAAVVMPVAEPVAMPVAGPVTSPADPDAFPTIEPPTWVAAPPAPTATAPTVAVVAAPSAPAEPEEPTEGSQLLHHLQIGVSYRLQLKDKFEKVRLTHMNASRTFFLFTHGVEDRGTISMTVRMLGRLCDTGRMKAFEDKPLFDRATERLRTQGPPPSPAAPVRKPELSTS